MKNLIKKIDINLENDNAFIQVEINNSDLKLIAQCSINTNRLDADFQRAFVEFDLSACEDNSSTQEHILEEILEELKTRFKNEVKTLEDFCEQIYLNRKNS